MALWHKTPVFPDLFDHYCLMSINSFLRNEARSSQKQTFARRQWAQHLLFLFFFQHLSQSIWLLLFVVNQLYSQKWRPKFSKAKFRSKTVSTIFAAFSLISTSFPIDLWKIAEKMWCSKKKWHFWVFTATERRSFWCFWRNVTKSDLWFFQRIVHRSSITRFCRSSIINVCRSRSWLIDRQS